MRTANINYANEIVNCLALPKIYSDDWLWWKTNNTRFLILSKLTRKYLTIPATSTPSKRLFSEASNIMHKKNTNNIKYVEKFDLL